MNDLRRIKVVYIVAHIDKAIGFEWIVERLDPARFDLSFVLLNEAASYLGDYLKRKGIPVYEIPFASKSKILNAIWAVLKILRKERPDVIHSHMLFADLVGHIAGRVLGVRKRIYTRHSANENRKYHTKQWLDKFVNGQVTDIVAISENVRRILIEDEGVNPKKISLIHHGFDMKGFANVNRASVQELSNKYNPRSRSPVVGVIARYVHWKGLQYIIPAFEQLLKRYPDAYLLIANAKVGSYKAEIDALLARLPNGSFYEIEFENDLFSLYQLFDVYVHTPIDNELEAFGQTYVEALAAGIPSVFTLSGVANEFIENERNALVVGYQNSDEILAAVLRLLESKDLRERLSAQGRADVVDRFSIEDQIRKFEKLYSE